MATTWLERFKWGIVKRLWDLPQEVVPAQAAPLKEEVPAPGPGRILGRGIPAPSEREAGAFLARPIRELHLRGSRSRRERAARSEPKAVMDYRGKGAKVERRSRKSIRRRKREG